VAKVPVGRAEPQQVRLVGDRSALTRNNVHIGVVIGVHIADRDRPPGSEGGDGPGRGEGAVRCLEPNGQLGQRQGDQIGPAVVVDVDHGRILGKDGRAEHRRDVPEAGAMVVLVQVEAKRGGVATAAHKQVGPAIAVVVDLVRAA